ncbi:hypothetical protein L6D11_21905, partial [Staphylococcus aureus]|nr:hypothetical protein [Staphylococcus aureus]
YKINNQISDKYLLVNDSFDKKIFTNNGVNFIFYKTKSNSLAIEVRKNNYLIQGKLDDITETKEKLIFKYKNFTLNKFIMKEKTNKMVPQIFEFSLKDNSINKNIILEKLPDLDADYDLFLENDSVE